MDQPVIPSMCPSTHQPSRTLKLGTPLRAAFMPLVPEASSGYCGVLSQIDAGSDLAAHFHVVLVEKNNGNGFTQRLLGLKNSADNVLAAAILRMGLAGVNDLKFSRSLSNLAQAVQVREDQVGALVSSGAAGEADGKSVRIKGQACFLADGFKELMFGNQMRRPDLFRWQS